MMIIKKSCLLLLIIFLGCNSPNYKKTFSQGFKHFEQGNYREAIRLLSLSLNLYPDKKKTRFLRAKSFLKIKEYQKAISDFSILITSQKKPGREEYILRGDCFFFLKKYRKALTDYNLALSSDYLNSKTYHKRGLLYIQIEAFKRAKSDLKYAFKLKPENAIICCDLGKYYLFKKQYKKAIEYLTQAIELKSDYAVAHYFLGKAYLGNTDKTKAFEQCTILDRINPKLKHKLFNLYLKQRDSIWKKRKF